MYLAKFAFFCSKSNGFSRIPAAKWCGCSKFQHLAQERPRCQVDFFKKKCFLKKSFHHLLSSSGAFLRLRCHQLLIIILNDSSESIKIRGRRRDLGYLCCVCTLHCALSTYGFLVISIHGSLAAELGVRALACQTDDDYVLYIITMKRRFEMKI